MLTNQTIDKLAALRLHGVVQALKDQSLSATMQSLSFEERLGLLIDAEYQLRENKRVARLQKQAKLTSNASIEDIDLHTPRGLNRELMTSLFTMQWVEQHGIIVLTGATGLGKTWIAEALARQATRKAYTVRFERFRRLLGRLAIAHADGSIDQARTELAKFNLLVLDDFGLGSPLTLREAEELNEVIFDRTNRGATIFTSQLPLENWYAFIGNADIADAILDRLAHKAYRLELRGETMRKQQSLTLVSGGSS